ncbi:MAG: glycine cleavage system protein GcvH [Chloroflexi bacterium]|nr:glycine cleavage system protein GcvH [Chloroflexota bacterium]
MEFPAELRYTTEDEWLRIDDDVATIGITDFAQDQLGDVVYVEVPDVGRMLTTGEAFGVIESVKAVSDLFSPIAGEVIARNDALTEQPELVNSSPYGDGWMIRVRMSAPAEIDALLTADAYRARLPADG